MTDQQRGAYTPPQDVPLEFDPRGPAMRRPLPLALIASAALLLVLLVAVVLYYRRGVRGDNDPPRPVGEPIAMLKTAPAAGAQPQDAAGDSDVAAPQNVPSRSPSFAAPPEAPLARPAPGALRVETLAPQDMPRAPGVSLKSPPPPPPASTSAQTQAQTQALVDRSDAQASAPAVPGVRQTSNGVAPPSAQVAFKAPRAAPAVTPTVSAAATPVETASVTGSVRVQIGAFSSAALADKGYQDVAALEPATIRGRVKHVEAVQKDGHTLYRTSVAGFADRNEAGAFCDALKAKGRICFVKF